MKRRIKAFFMAAVMALSVVVSAFGNATVAHAEDLVVKLHYHREDGDYTDWSVWFWEAGAGGADFAFAEENGEMVATVVVTPGTSSLGFIVRKPDWTKDMDMDQFIDLAECVSGTVHVYVESGVEGYTKEYGDDVVLGTKVLSAAYEDGKVSVTMTMPLESSEGVFTVQSKDGIAEIAEIEEDGVLYSLKMAEELDISKKYTVTYDGKEYEISMPDYYSTEEFETLYTYSGDDLGATWTKNSTTFRVWSPLAEAVTVNLYRNGAEGINDLIEKIEMTPDVNGTWVAAKEGDINGKYYTYTVTLDGEKAETCDPYARTTGVNGKRAMVIDLDSTDPEGWENDENPNAGMSINDAVIYELHIRDLGMDESSGIDNAGKYLSLTEHGTTTESGIATGIDHIKELGVTHLHILPMYDYGSVNEVYSDTFNWGYDPVNYNVPEGSYATNPFNGDVRVKEVKQMVQSLHNDGISVVMDVVYNHVQDAGSFCFNQLVPDYFSRVDAATGAYSNGSGCGNDTATERSMVKKYIVDSVKYWADEYHIDGFRFDLVGLIDTETINEIMTEVHKTHPDVIFYGEGWTMGTELTKEGYTLTTQTNSTEVPGFAFFSDTIRDGMKGNVFNNTEAGYVSGAEGLESVIESCFLGLADPWCTTPAQSVNYASCHDNMTLFDRLKNSRPDASEEDLVKMNNLAAAIYLTAEGIPFMQAGEEMLRTKVKEDGTFDENSYSSSDEVNSLKWDSLDDAVYMDTFEYYKGLIAFRKAHGALRLTNAEDVKASITVVDGLDANVTAFNIKGGVNGETADALFVIFNPNAESTEVTLPEGSWNIYINSGDAGTEILGTASGTVTVNPISAMVLVQEAEAPVDETESDLDKEPGVEKKDNSAALIVGGVAVVAVAAGAAAAVIGKKKKTDK